MNPLATHDSCVCVQSVSGKSVNTKRRGVKPQEGGLCEKTHTRLRAVERCSSSIVASQSASSVVGETPRSASRVLALCEVTDNA